LDEIMAPAEIAAAKERAANFTPVAINQPANGIFKNLPWNKDNERRAAERSAQVKQVQTLLNDLGFDAGTADGIMGRKTRQAINSFERVNGLNETGQISEDLIDRLSVAAGA
jgi:localization factor PodJL